MTTEELFPRIERSSAVLLASNRIRDMILSGRLQPGDRLPPERELSRALGMSRPTVRETIRSLVAMNILESRHGSGTFVASLDTRELLRPVSFVLALASRALDDLFEARLLVEPPIAALAAERASDDDVEALRQCAARALACRNDREALMAADAELHRLIAAASHNDLLVTLLDSLASLLGQSRSLTSRVPGLPDRTLPDQTELVEAIAARDPERARAAMTAHLRRVADAARAAAAPSPGTPPGTPRDTPPDASPDQDEWGRTDRMDR